MDSRGEAAGDRRVYVGLARMQITKWGWSAPIVVAGL